MPDASQCFIAMFTPARETFPGDGTPEEFARVNEHFEQLKKDQENGVLIVAGRTQDYNPAGIYIFKAESQEAAETRIREDAAIKSGVFVLQWVRPYAVALFRAP
ncbi:MAG: uncharacterized protein QOJ65_935 [Fimbriimonadaceae bacterium]|jgi:uncharacterized protein YciI|nr:uncharacterized protein [Fimbriimonadaceae bacterium]